MRVDLEVSGAVSRSTRARQLEGSFDVPPADNQTLRWHADVPIEERDWSIGLIVGPSGCGKSTLLAHTFGAADELTWGDSGVVDDFPADTSVEQIANVCSAVGFNTIPAWLRPYRVLSNGERFRVELARRLASAQPGVPLVLDEWTSVVDRQVARIGSAAAAKYVRRNGLQLVAATCHYDVEDWLQPDWVLEPRPSHLDDTAAAVSSPFRWRSVQPRPDVQIEITPARYEAWELFAPFHYLTSGLNHAAKCYVLWARTDDEHEWQPAAFTGILHRPHLAPKAGPVWGLSRTVTLPDWQGLGLAHVLTDTLASAYRTVGCQVHSYPAHPAYIRARDRSPSWQLIQRPEIQSTQAGPNSKTAGKWRPRGRPNAVFRYCGPHMASRHDAVLLFRCGR
jgi:energy-coupling factor transporter ATP-binding protein EcfA2/GNAT superfamily N-acetyltransferase